jgi:hypothetical protein
MTATIERKWSMIRLDAGDYLLPSNDRRTLWRVMSYTEDGSAMVDDGRGGIRHLTGTWWQIAKCRVFDVDVSGGWEESIERLPRDLIDPNMFPDYWDVWESGLRTRRDAVAAALRASEREAGDGS